MKKFLMLWLFFFGTLTLSTTTSFTENDVINYRKAVGKTQGGYAKFNSWESSVYDYSLWQNYVLSKKGNLSREQYLNMLDKIYSESKGYSKKVTKIIKEHDEVLVN